MLSKAEENGKKDVKRRKNFIVACSFISNISILFVFKYLGFAFRNVNILLNTFGFEIIHRSFDFLLPVGISFYTFQALSYTIDVYRGTISAEKNFFKYALFVSYFPQLVAGPIERSKNLLSQINNMDQLQLWNLDRIKNGLLLMIWGFFQKLVIADRAAVFVNTVYQSYQSYGFLEITMAAILFAFQIYCDFDGYSNIARGAAQVMGINIMKNFRQPYLAVGIKDFWGRWHISLTSWFTDYLYIPLGGNRKGILKQYRNIMIVFLISGLWHGASWNFIIWGLLHGFYQIIGNIKNKLKMYKIKTYRQDETEKLALSARIRKMITTFLLVDFAWIFFRAGSASVGIKMIRQMAALSHGALFHNSGLIIGDWIILTAALAVLAIVDILHEKNISIRAFIERQEIWFRWGIYLGSIWSILIFGVYGTGYDIGKFIYFQF